MSASPNTPPTDLYATAVLQGCLASIPNAAAFLATNPSVLATFLNNVQTITVAALQARTALLGQQGG